jgi:hypothetical protein
VKKSKKTLEQIVKSHLVNNNITPEIALTSMLGFYKNHPTESTEPDDDMLLFQYGTYDWDGKGGKFELNLTRQIADPNDDEFYQVRLTLYYRPGDIGEIEGYNLWNIDKPALQDWKETVADTDGFRRAAKAKPFDYKVDLVKT